MSLDNGGSISPNSFELDDVEQQITLGTSVVEIVKADPKRVFLLIQNTSDTDVRISTKPTVTTSIGIKLVAVTGDIAYSKRDHGSLVTRAFFGVTSADNKVIQVQEAFVKKKAEVK